VRPSASALLTARLDFSSQEDLANIACIKKKKQNQQLEEEVAGCPDNDRGLVLGGVDNDYAIESPVGTAPHYLMLTKQNSFDHDESLGILTPDQMTDFTVALESSRTPSCENLSGHANSGESGKATRPIRLPCPCACFSFNLWCTLHGVIHERASWILASRWASHFSP
jgi:hypothetical protein